jgi:hypothetical protein
MDEDQILQSIIADPKLTDPSIDVGKLRQTTPTRAELLADVPEFFGLKFDPTQRSYVEDLYALYGGGAPMVPETVVDTSVVDTTPIVDTSVMDQPAGDSVLDTTPTITTPQDFGQSLVDQGIGVQATPIDPVVAPGEMPLTQDDFDDFNKIAVTPQTFADTGRADLLDQAGNVPGVGFATDFFPDIDTNVGTVLGKPGIERFDDAEAGIDIFEDTATRQAETPVAFDRPTIADVAGPVRLSQQDIIGTDANVGFIDAPDLETEDIDMQGNLSQSGLNKIRDLIPDFDPVVTAGKLALNTFIGKPVSLVIDAIQALPSGISETTNKARDVGLLVGDTTVTQDKYGINTQSAFGNYDKYNIERVEFLENKVNKTPRDIQELQERTDYVNQRADIDKDPTGDAQIAEETIGTLPEITEARQETAEQIKEIEAQPVVQSGSDEAREQQDRTGVANVSTGIGGRGSGGYQTKSGDVYASAAEAAEKSDGGGGGSTKIVCTMMNKSYGFGSFRNKIWLRHSKGLAPEYQKGYHKIFLPLVKLSKKNIVLKKILEHIAVHRTIDIRQESRGKIHLLGRVYRKILEPICYWVGKHD